MTSNGSIGELLHQKVNADYWSVTREDLRYLRKEVKRAISEGRIVPTEKDPGPWDDSCGPSVYTVTDQYIKPVTAEAGNMSWALMRHPEGIQCDIFVTHAWAEGIFEFIDKVLETWPRDSHSAWCCMLANPQNLDISGLITSPKDSPFAKALEQAKYMLVVSNAKLSIYSRLWCVYEAHLAFQWQKIILGSGRSLLLPAIRGLTFIVSIAVPFAACAYGLDVAIRCHVGMDAVEAYRKVCELMWIICTVMTLLQNNQALRRFWHVVGTGLILNVNHFLNPDSVGGRYFQLIGALFFCVAEVDRIRYLERQTELVELEQEFKGSVKFADCSNEDDRRSIQNDIGEDVDDVDHTIDVLRLSGMSTPRLQHLADEGIDISNAAVADFALPVQSTALTVLKMCVAWHFSQHQWGKVFAVASTIIPLIFWIQYFRLQPDEKAFALKVLSKVSVPMLLLYLSYSACEQLDTADEKYQCHAERIVMTLIIETVLYSLAIFLMALPVQRLTHRYFGRQVVKIIMARGFGDVICKRRKTHQEVSVKARMRARSSTRGNLSSGKSWASTTSTQSTDVDLEAHTSVQASRVISSSTIEEERSECSCV